MRETPSSTKGECYNLGCITWQGMGTVTTVEGTINSHKYIDILEKNLWPVIARQNFLFQDDNSPIHRSRDVKNDKGRNIIIKE